MNRHEEEEIKRRKPTVVVSGLIKDGGRFLLVKIEIIRALGFGEDFAFHQTHGYRRHRVVIYFLCKSKTNITYYNDEGGKGSRMRWVTLEEMKGIGDLEPAFKDMMDRFDPN